MEGCNDLCGEFGCLEYGGGWGWVYGRENGIYFGLCGFSVVLNLIIVFC